MSAHVPETYPSSIWTTADLRRLRELIAAGVRADDAAREMGRGIGETRAMRRELTRGGGS